MTRRIALLLVVVTLCMGCGGRSRMRQLQALEAQIDSVPHLVRQGLDSIPFATLRGEARALYAILKTQADYKCYVPLTTDTLIRYATNYYNRSRKNYRAAMAWYSLGCVYSEMKDDASAVEAYLQAQRLFPDTTVLYYQLCYQNLGQHYMNKKMPDEALEAYVAYHNVVDECDHLYADIGLAQAYIHKKQPERAREILQGLLQYRAEMDTLSFGTVLFDLGKIEYTFSKDYDKADEYFNQLIALYGVDQVDATYWFKGSIAESRENSDTARYYYELAMQGYDEIYLQYNCARSLLYLTLDSTAQPELYGYIKRFEQASDSINRIERRSEIDEIRTAHQMELQQRELAERHRAFIYIIVFAIVCLLAVIIIGILLFEYRRKQYYLRLQRELQRNQARIYKMYQSIEEKRDNGSLTREKMLEIYRDNLSKNIALFKEERWAVRLQQLSEQRSKDIPPFTIKEREQLADVLERCFINVITNLRDEATKQKSRLSAEDIHLCLLLSLGYSIGVIRECLAASSDDVVRKRRVRLAGKLPEDILLLLFGKI
jgi:tetratricopeptide (TPR) repeat protein